MLGQWRNRFQELRELGLAPAIFRLRWEVGERLRRPEPAPIVPLAATDAKAWTGRLLFADPDTVRAAMVGRIPRENMEGLRVAARNAKQGMIRCFGRWDGVFGDPIDWYRDPLSGRHWPADVSASIALRRGAELGEVKLVWEAARFPHAYHFARAATFKAVDPEELAGALARQIESFEQAALYGRGIHWSSGQEIAIRLLAWAFSFDALLSRRASMGRTAATVGRATWLGAHHIERRIEYARRAVNNNHLISEGLALYLAGVMFRGTSEGSRWCPSGRATLEREAERQFYPDGAYLNLSHNYHRNVVQLLLWSVSLARISGDRPAESWMRAIDRSLDFLVAHQNPNDGRLPNFGPNDGSLPSLLSTCDFSDFRPTLQAASIVARGERLYEPGPWDEEAAWWVGARAVDAPLRPPRRTSRSFVHTGFCVLRAPDAETFATLRCGSVLDRFGQSDMLHVDYWWRGVNVAQDGGSYLYNGPPDLHAHFDGTASHNTLTVDGRDQMLHWRRFKHLYWTRAKLETFEADGDPQVCAGEHYGYERHAGGCVHRRAVALFGSDILVVTDLVEGVGEHRLRIHWLLASLSARQSGDEAVVALETPRGPFSVGVFDADGCPERGSLVQGQLAPPRGWVSRYYGEKSPAPSLAIEHRGSLPKLWVSVFGPGVVDVNVKSDVWTVSCDARECSFRLLAGFIPTHGAP